MKIDLFGPDLCQDKNRGSVFSTYLKGMAPLNLWYINPKEKICACCFFIWVNVPMF